LKSNNETDDYIVLITCWFIVCIIKNVTA